MRRLWICTAVLAMASVAWGSGDFERANSEYLSIADHADWTLDWSVGWTVAGWIKVDSLGGGAGAVNWLIYLNPGVYMSISESDSPADKVAFWYNGGLLGPTDASNRAASTDWMHLAMVGSNVDTSKHIDCYIDGSAVRVTLAYSTKNPTTIYIGTNGTSYANASIAEVAVWQSPLSQENITSLQTAQPSTVGTPDIYIPLFDDIEDKGSNALTITNHGVTNDSGTHPPVGVDPVPNAVTMVWPAAAADYNEVGYQTYIVWTKTPADTELDQRFTVYCDTSNPPTTNEANEITALYTSLDGLLPDTTYYVRVDANSAGGVTQGTVIPFTTRSISSGTLYYVSPLGGTGDDSGSTEPNAMPWSDVATQTATGDTIRLIEPNSVIYYNYEGSYSEWPDRIYEANEVTEYGITRTFQDWRRIGRFIDGSYWVVGPAIIMSYSPTRTTMDGAVVNGMMVNPSGTDTGLDGRGVSYPGNYDVTLDHGDELPYMVNTYPASVLNEDAIDSGDTEWQTGGWYGAKAVSILTVVETPLASNIWFRPSYRGYFGKAVEHQWSDVQTSRIPQIDLNCGYTLQATTQDDDRGGTGGGIAGGWTAVERIVSRPAIQLANGWTNSRYIVAYHQASSYGSYVSMEQSVAYLALFDSDLGTLTGAKKRLLIGCIQRGIDYSGVYLEGDNETWFSADGGSTNGSYWPILFAGIMLNDEDLYDIGLDTNQDKDDPWNYSAYFSVSENDQPFQITASGETSWAEGPPWLVTAIPSATDNSGTCSVTHDSTTVHFEVGETWSWAKSIAAFSAYDGTHTQVDTTAAHGFANQSYVRICGTTNYNSTASHQITVIDADSFYYLKTYVADDAAGVVYQCSAYGPLQFVTTTVGATTTCADNSLTAVGARAYNVAAVTLGSPYSVTLATAYGGETDAEATFVIAQLVCLGEQFSATHFADYTEFDSSWLGRYWWTEKPTMDWRITGAVYDEAAYQSISSSSVAGTVLCAVLMQREGAYAAVTKWNSPQTFGYYEWFHTSETAWSGYGDDWVETVFGNEWQWPVSSGGTIATPSVFKSPIFGGVVQ